MQSKDSEFNKTLKQLEQQLNNSASTLRTENQPPISLLSNSGDKTVPFSPQELNGAQEIETKTDNRNLGKNFFRKYCNLKPQKFKRKIRKFSSLITFFKKLNHVYLNE